MDGGGLTPVEEWGDGGGNAMYQNIQRIEKKKKKKRMRERWELEQKQNTSRKLSRTQAKHCYGKW